MGLDNFASEGAAGRVFGLGFRLGLLEVRLKVLGFATHLVVLLQTI